jgi:hypothetical protein
MILYYIFVFNPRYIYLFLKHESYIIIIMKYYFNRVQIDYIINAFNYRAGNGYTDFKNSTFCYHQLKLFFKFILFFIELYEFDMLLFVYTI